MSETSPQGLNLKIEDAVKRELVSTTELPTQSVKPETPVSAAMTSAISMAATETPPTTVIPSTSETAAQPDDEVKQLLEQTQESLTQTIVQANDLEIAFNSVDDNNPQAIKTYNLQKTDLLDKIVNTLLRNYNSALNKAKLASPQGSNIFAFASQFNKDHADLYNDIVNLRNRVQKFPDATTMTLRTRKLPNTNQVPPAVEPIQ